MTQPVPYTPAQVERDPSSGFPGEFDSQNVPVLFGSLAQYEWLGIPMPTADEAVRGVLDGTWGLRPTSHELDGRNQYYMPSASSERVQQFDIFRCIDVPANAIIPTGIAFELVHWRIPTGSVGIVEDIPISWDDVTALDGAGLPIFSYNSLNGERLCLHELVHPDPLVTEPLTWEFRLQFSDDPSQGHRPTDSMVYQGPIFPEIIRGHSIIPPWRDARYGAQNRWAETRQFIVSSSTIVRMWIVLFGPTARFRVRVGGRLGGFHQLGGRKAAALNSVLTRRV